MSLWLEQAGTSWLVGHARRSRRGSWCATIIHDRSGSVDFRHQRLVGVYTDAVDAALALLCCEEPILRAIASA